MPACSHCSKPRAQKSCSRCSTVCYCSRDCQKAAWKAHKKACKSTPKSTFNPTKFKLDSQEEEEEVVDDPAQSTSVTNGNSDELEDEDEDKPPPPPNPYAVWDGPNRMEEGLRSGRYAALCRSPEEFAMISQVVRGVRENLEGRYGRDPRKS
ncbi:hypothetical protein BJ508DRAFT_93339 [Ascobolus immersus RN42]|uniref:MYND-type domain-containing protein n=1 Tax=Ascobolus immersus RN42 TaxID=1160509 RepID=A0A3N4I9T2_ASCIM|nr:hypothetical protein BJ508DRAFT_93339 [Ascobolus immersus RN42]